MKEQDIKNIIYQTLMSSSNMIVPRHTHNGVDSPKLFNNTVVAQNHLLVGNASGQGIDAGSNLTWDGSDFFIGGKLTVTGAIDPTMLFLDEQVSDPTNVANKGVLYTKDVTGITQLFYETSNGTLYQLTPTTGGTGTITSIATTLPITGGTITTTGTIGITKSDASTNGYLSSTDWTTFNNKGSGTVTSVGTGTGLTGGTITTTGTISLDSKLAPADSLTGNSLKFLRVNAGETAVEYATPTIGITSINTDSTTAQTLSIGIAGTDFAIINNGTGDHKFNLPIASAVNTGKLSSTDWSTFNSKQNALTIGDLTDTTAIDGITITGGTGAVIGSGTDISQRVSDATHNGYLSSTDWNTFNGKSTVVPAALTKVDDTNVTLTLGGTPATALLQATSITAGWTGTLADARITSSANWNTAYTNRITSLTTTGTSGAATLIANVLNIPNYSIAGLSPLTTKGDLFTFSTVNARLGIGSDATILMADAAAATGNKWVSLSGDATLGLTGAVTLATVNSNVGTFGSATKSVTATVNAKGLVTAISEATITPAASSITGGAALIKTDDTNVTLTLGGSPTTALLAATSLTLGWTGTLAPSRGGTGLDTSASTGIAQVNAGAWSVSTALANGTTATTQSANDNTTKVATTAYVDAVKFGDNIMLLPVMYHTITQGTWAFSSYSANTQIVNFVFINGTSTAQNDQIDWRVTCPTGTYNCTIVGAKSSNRAIYTLLIDGVSAGTVDAYNASTVNNQRMTITGFSVTAGQHTISIKAATKNASSSNYFIGIDFMNIYRQ